MKKILLCAVGMAAAMAVNAECVKDANVAALSGKDVDVVVHNGARGFNIKGIFWAEYNVGTVSDADTGGYFTWEEALTVCPDGWRLPTAAEFAKLSKAPNRRTVSHGEGRTFFVGRGKRIQGEGVYFPAAGSRDPDGTLSKVVNGAYWSSTPAVDDFVRILFFSSDGVAHNNRKDGPVAGRDWKLPVRCVKE